MNRLLLAGGFGALIAAAVLSTGVARADVNDDAFVKVITDRGIAYTSEAKLIAAGHAVCDSRAQGYTEMQIVSLIVTKTQLTDAHDAGYFVGAAEAAYCPQFAGLDVAPNSGPLKRLILMTDNLLDSVNNVE